jgi:hypothetical protein
MIKNPLSTILLNMEDLYIFCQESINLLIFYALFYINCLNNLLINI